MAPLEVEFMPRRLQKTILALLFHFSNVPLLFHFFKRLVIVSFFKPPVFVSFFQLSVIIFYFFNRHRYCLIFAIIPYLFHFLQSSRFCFIFSIVPFLFHFINRPNWKKFLALVGVKPRTSWSAVSCADHYTTGNSYSRQLVKQKNTIVFLKDCCCR